MRKVFFFASLRLCVLCVDLAWFPDFFAVQRFKEDA